MSTAVQERAAPTATAAAPPARTLRGDIQALRAIAVLLVFADHLLGLPAGGFVGVDVFFVISGYLITGLLLREAERTGAVSLREFYARRLRRLLPVALLVLVTTAVAARLVLPAARAAQATTDGLWAAVFAANLRFSAVGTDYFAQSLPPSPFQHYWSLSVEEQFYVAWPLLLLAALWGARRLSLPVRGVAVPVLGAAVLASGAWCLHVLSVEGSGAYFSTFARAWELGAGALVAVAQPALLRLPKALRRRAAWWGLAGIALAALAVDSATPWPGPVTLLPVLATALVLGAHDPAGGPGRSRLLASRPVGYVGLLSYSLYLWHWPAIVLAEGALPDRGALFWVAAGVAPFVLAVLSHHLVEKPVHHSRWLSRRPDRSTESRRTVVGAGAITLTAALVAGCAAYTVAKPAAPQSAPPVAPSFGPEDVRAALDLTAWPADLQPALAALPESGAPEWRQEDCLDVTPDALQRCTYGDPEADRTAVLLGDSIAISWLPGIRAALGDGWRIVPLTLEECPFVDLPTYRQAPQPAAQRYVACDRQREFALEQVRSLQPDLVVSSGHGRVFSTRVLGLPEGTPHVQEWGEGTERALAYAREATDRLVLLGGTPGDADLQRCATPQSTPADCVIDLPEHWSALVGAEAAAAAATGSTYVDTTSWFCADGRCPSVVDGTPVHWDGLHLTAAFAERAAPLLRPLLLGEGVR